MRNEPIARGGGKPHLCEEIVRQGGELVYLAAGYPQGVTESERMRLMNRNPKLRHLHWVAQRRNPSVFVRGRVRHPDHKTIVLNGWHQVLMNTENQSIDATRRIHRLIIGPVRQYGAFVQADVARCRKALLL